MRDILIVSDTHGRRERLSELIKYRQKLIKNGDPLTIIHLGDGLSDLFSCPQYDEIVSFSVRGNCDFSITDRMSPYGEEMPIYRLIHIDKYKVLITHGHAFSVKSGYDEICREESNMGADFVLFGHTHLPTLEYINKGSIRGVERDLVLFNPGALSDMFNGSFGNLSISENRFLFSHGSYNNLIKKQ